MGVSLFGDDVWEYESSEYQEAPSYPKLTLGISGSSHSRGELLWAAGCDDVGYFWRGRDIFQGETNKVVSREVLPVKQPEFKVFGRNVGDRMTAMAQRDTGMALHHARTD